MRFLLLLALACLLPASEEFVGPFQSWTTFHTRRAASGTPDDTDEMQAALTQLGVAPGSPVLYFPAGTYYVSRTLVLAARQNVRIIGEDPGKVRIKWTGAAGGTLLRLNGVAYSEINRVTFDGGGTAAVLVDQSWDNATGYFDTADQYADDVFTSAGTGILGGRLDQGFAETSVVRGSFLSLGTGIALKNFNALDLWVWDSLFDHCKVGISNVPGAGNWRVYNSTFLDSTTADNYIGNTGGFSFIGNYSRGAAPFLLSVYTSNPAWITLQRNTINPSPESATPAVVIANQGPVILLDNRIGAGKGSGPAVSADHVGDTDVISVGNRFASAKGVAVAGRVTSVDDQTGQAMVLTQPALPGVPGNRNRKVIEVEAGASSDRIQEAINTAAKLTGSSPVVHLPFGQYGAVSVTIPPSDIQIIGDGLGATNIRGSMRLLGPATHVSLRDFTITGTDNAGDGISIAGADQQGARVFLDEMQPSGSGTNVLLDGADRAVVEARDFVHRAAKETSVRIEGKGTVNIMDAASFGSPVSYAVAGGTLLVRDEWYDSGGPVFLRATGASTVTVIGSAVATPEKSPVAAFQFTGFTGTAALLAIQEFGRIAAAESPGRILGAGLLSMQADYFSTQGGAQPVMVHNKQQDVDPKRTSGSKTLPDQGSPAPALLRAALEQVRRTVAGPISDLPASVTDVRMHRVGVEGFRIGIHILP